MSLRQPSSRRYVALLVLVTAVAVLVGAGWRLHGKVPLRTTTVSIGKPLPSIVVADTAGKRVDLAAQMAGGSRSVVVFYSPSCEVCRQELPQIMPFPPQLQLILVREPGDAGPDPLATGTNGRRFADGDGALKRAFVMPVLPTVLLIDERGIVRDGLVGAHEGRFAQKRLIAFAQRSS